MNIFLQLGIILALVGIPIVCVLVLIKQSIRRGESKRAARYQAWQDEQDQSLRSTGHSEAFIGGTRKIRDLKVQRSGSAAGAFLGAVLCVILLIAYPPAGLFVTLWYIIAIVRFSFKSHRESQTLGLQIEAESQRLPKK